MKSKVKTGKGFGGVMRYAADKPGASFIAGTQPTPRDFLREAAALRALRPDCKKPVLHLSLSLPSGERLLSDEAWRNTVERFLEKMNLSGHSFYCVRHSDTDHDHVHIVTNMISPAGIRWNSDKSALRAQAACSEIEQELGLQQTRTLDDFRAAEGLRRRIVRDGATNEFRRTGKVKTSVQLAIQRRKAKETEREQNRAAHQRATDLGAGLGEKQGGTRQEAARAIQVDEQPHLRPGSRTGEGFRTDSRPVTAPRSAGAKTDRPVQPVQVAPAAARPAAIPERGDEMRLFKKQPTETPAPQPPAPATTTQPIGSIAAAVPGFSRPSSEPPTLSGRLMPVRLMNGHFDLFWKDRADGKPSFRWQPGPPTSADQRLLILTQPNERNVAALFDAAAEKGIGMPQIQITGTPEFQRMAAQEAARRGLPVDTSKLDETACELYRQAWDTHHSEAANAITSSAYESQERDRQERAAQSASERDAANSDERNGDDDRSAMRMKG